MSRPVLLRRASVPTWLCLAVAAALALGATRATAAADPRELKAREAFVSGEYKQALELFAKLYAETLHPVYLRNIGRCYQNLGDPDRALVSFRDYLRKHKTITPEERTEVEGFIAEMEELKKQRRTSASVTPLPSAPEPANSGGKPEALVTAAAGPPGEESSPVYTRWWFWTIVAAAAVGAGLGIAAATGAFTQVDEPSCPSMFRCTR